MRIRLDHHSGEPIWRQIVEQVKYGVASAALEPGDQLPSIRALAGELNINPRTVVKAYEELDHMGLVVMRHGQGVFIANRRPDVTASARHRVLEELARRLLAEGARLGAGPDEVIALLESVAEKMERQHG